MPRIEAETVVEHRRLREAKMLAAARSLLDEHGPMGVTPGAVASAVGLSRTAIYKYFASRDDLLERIVEDSFADWLGAVTEAVDQAPGVVRKIDAYVHTSLALGMQGAHRMAVLAGGPLRDDRARVAEHHRELTAPLTNVLNQSGVEHAAIIADLIDGIIGRAIAQIDAGAPHELVTDTTLGLISRALDLDQHDKRVRTQP